jgi:hypothetical protein
MTTRRALFAAALLPALAPGAARGFRLEQADGGTEALLAARAEACTGEPLHARLRAELAAATAGLEGTDQAALAEAAVRHLAQCPVCGCRLVPDAARDAAPGF